MAGAWLEDRSELLGVVLGSTSTWRSVPLVGHGSVDISSRGRVEEKWVMQEVMTVSYIIAL